MALKILIQCGFFLFGLVISLLIFGPLSFSLAAEQTSSFTQSIRREIEQESLAEAMNAFRAGDYRSAKITFGILIESTQNPDIARQALFGLASIKLILANTSEEYEDAISSWKKWSGEVNSCKGCEDPRMITPFLLRLQSSIKGADGSLPEGKSSRAAKALGPRVILQTMEKEMQALRSKLEMREREIRRLRQQIESLEEIHRKYQQKKREATQ